MRRVELYQQFLAVVTSFSACICPFTEFITDPRSVGPFSLSQAVALIFLSRVEIAIPLLANLYHLCGAHVSILIVSPPSHYHVELDAELDPCDWLYSLKKKI